MRVAILGAGVGGLAAAVGLGRSGHEVAVYERAPAPRDGGQGLLMMPDGLAALTALGLGDPLPGAPLDRVLGYAVAPAADPPLRLVLDVALPPSRAVRREQLIALLERAVPGPIRYGKRLVGWARAGANVEAAQFEDGTVATADLFVAADGVRSWARESLFPEARPTPVRVFELVSRLSTPALAAAWWGTRLQLSVAGLKVALVATDDDVVVWTLQWDAHRWAPPPEDAASRGAFVRARVAGWPAPVPELIDRTDFVRSHLWHTTDLDLLERFHHGNVVLLGDAAHPLLPFAAEGATAALQDAVVLRDSLQQANLADALARYDVQRRPVVGEALRTGRAIRAQFLDPGPERAPVVVRRP